MKDTLHAQAEFADCGTIGYFAVKAYRTNGPGIGLPECPVVEEEKTWPLEQGMMSGKNTLGYT